jgi:hypothetical protein
MAAADIVLLIGGILFIIDGIIKIIKPDFRFLRMTMPCGVALAVVGTGLLLKALGY